MIIPDSGPASSLRTIARLFALRNLAIVGQIAAIVLAHLWLGFRLPLAAMGGAVVCLAAINVHAWHLLRRGLPVGEGTVFAQLLGDVAVLTAQLYWSGGATNPFVSLYLLPLTIAAAGLEKRYTWAMALVTVACYSGLVFWHEPLVTEDDAAPPFDLHVTGMWLNFVVSAALTAFFVVRIAATLRERDRLLAAAREKALRDQQVVALGTLAAGAAHEIGSPLATIAVLAREMERDFGADPDLGPTVVSLRKQVETCKRIVTDLMASAGQMRAEGGGPQPLDRFIESAVARWQELRPGARVALVLEGERPAPRIVAEQTVSQTLASLLNNAADASSDGIELEARWNPERLVVEIRDRGDGLEPAAAARAGEAFFTTKDPGRGIGLGLFLAKMAIERLGGEVVLSNRAGGGACTRIDLPLAQLRVSG